MPVYLFTYHAYRSWMPNHRRGFVQKDKGIQEPNPNLARAYQNAAKHPPFTLDRNTQQFLIVTVRDICHRRGWRLHGVSTEPTHLHVLVSSQDSTTWQTVRGKIKNIISTELSKRAGQFGRPWFADKASRKRVNDQLHLDFLLRQYLPKHGGAKWFELAADR